MINYTLPGEVADRNLTYRFSFLDDTFCHRKLVCCWGNSYRTDRRQMEKIEKNKKRKERRFRKNGSNIRENLSGNYL
ncbi:hypothetical protein C823_001306 [Eubacterium plexicaudatum ASF492]|uniref:Uncharacterized protein n=1 Tax=Eubacterium plexicaudatum ASF492 TaxID=1235802 RepID=N2BGD2_9FIRM|nr:hypothetical protein C823_001306 [Eubacterium plexicaudatum ASF492]